VIFLLFWGWRGRMTTNENHRWEWKVQLEHGIATKNLGRGLAYLLFDFYFFHISFI